MTADDVRDMRRAREYILDEASYVDDAEVQREMREVAATLERLATVHGHDDPGLPSMDYVEGVCDGIEAYSDTLRNEARIAALRERRKK
jgi:hypothetical protein